jgi:hypothetical protein
MTNFLQEKSKSNVAPVTSLTGDEAAKLIGSGSFEDCAGFDDLEASRLGVKVGQIVSVVPNDTGETFLLTLCVLIY